MSPTPANIAKLDQAVAEYSTMLDEAVERMRKALISPNKNAPEMTIAAVAFAMADLAASSPAIRDMIISEYAIALYRLAQHEEQ